MNLLFADVETGGLNPEKHSLLQVGIAAYKDGKIVDTLNIFIKEDTYCVTPEAMKINGLDLAEIKKNGIDKFAAVDMIVRFIEKNFGTEKPILTGHNVNFDKNFLQQLFLYTSNNIEKFIGHRMIDTMSLLWGLYDAGKVPFEACNSKGAFDHFEIVVEKLHDALDDTLATVKLYKECIKLIKG